MANKNNWFDDTFLPSLFERPSPNGFIWLSEKQADCFCRQRGVKENQHLTQNTINGGFYISHVTFTYEWRGRKLTVCPCNSGIARLYFGNTEEEKKEFLRNNDKERQNIRLESVQRMKNKRPEKFQEMFHLATENLLLCIKLFDACAASENDVELEDALFDLEEAEKRYFLYYFA